MVKMIVVYESEPDPSRYAQHVELMEKVQGGVFRHGRVFGNPFGEPEFRYVAELEFPDRESFDRAARTPEFAATGRDAIEMGIPFKVHFAELS